MRLAEQSIRFLVGCLCEQGITHKAGAGVYIDEANKAVFIGCHEGLIIHSDRLASVWIVDDAETDSPDVVWVPVESVKLCYAASTIPFLGMNEPPRPLTVCCNMPQAISVTGTTGISLVKSFTPTRALLTTEIDTRVAAALPGEIGNPGFECSVCYAPHDLNYEDCVVVSQGFAQRLSYYASAQSILGCEGFQVASGQKVGKWESCPESSFPTWYKSDLPATVEWTLPDSTGRQVCRVDRLQPLCPGDKVASRHGQKHTVYLLRDEDMPYGECPVSGSHCVFDIVVAPASIFNGCTVGAESICSLLLCSPGNDALLHAKMLHKDPRNHLIMENMDKPHIVACEVVKPGKTTKCILYDGATGMLYGNTEEEHWYGETNVFNQATYGVCRVQTSSNGPMLLQSAP